MPENYNSENTVLPFLQGGGSMGELIRRYNWETTPVGEPLNWPVQLKQQTGILLNSLSPMLICWGAELTQLYNDAFMQLFGQIKHPAALGKPFFQTYAEAQDVLQPIIKKVLQGEAFAYPDFKLGLNNNGSIEEVYLDFSCTPITDEYMNVHGVLMICFETTASLSDLKDAQQSNKEISRSNRELVTDNEQLSGSQQNLRRIVYELAESEHRIRSIIDNAPFPIGVYLGADLRVSLANQAIIDVWGKGPNVIGKPYKEILPELVNQAVFEQLDAVYRTGKTFHARNQQLDLVVNGLSTTSYFNYSFNALRDQEGKIYGVMNTAADVTDAVVARQRVEEASDELAALNEELAASNEEMQSVNEELQSVNEELASTNEELNESRQQLEAANEELAASMSRLRMAIESTGLGTWEYIPTTGELFWSTELREIYGMSASEPATMEGFDAHIHPDDYVWVHQHIASAMSPATGGRYDLNYRITRFDNNEIRWIKVQGSVYFENEQPVRFIGTAFDITEMKLAEEQTAKLAAIIASSDDAIISKNFDSIITSWNTSAERIFGYTADEMLGESLYKLIPADRHHEEPLILSSVREGKRVQHFETKRLTKDGRLIDVSVTVSPIRDKQGNIIGLSKIARDITERKLDEIRKNDFIGMVSHELKTPLTSLSAILQVTKAKLNNSDDAFLAGAMQKANLQVKRMTAMINGFLNISRLESGKILIQKQAFDLAKLIAGVVDEVKVTATTHTIIIKDCQEIEVNADEDKIQSVISNLISNAIKYSPIGSEVQVSCAMFNNEAVVGIKDQGIGIKPADAERIFDRYYRVETLDTKHISGFGIGLYLSAEIIQHHNGRIWLDSEPGKGSTFYFSLPLLNV
ncbi:PAS domain S-box protein [Mucilaginibacter auburnensis]|uniref:histidine kinase n=1 Tax=Mucilaginibacter auburnensis TaxID=1457233 RepID=A0A2H9VSY0_9SPHI|nr:PAS domain S-box protein [Mucilaginibacter auburnensis]PJJ83931.1 PAS domain S-box-containing protein [Mucilaginibacter auburnensis]